MRGVVLVWLNYSLDPLRPSILRRWFLTTPESSEAERVHFPYMGEAVRATKRTGTNFAGKES